MLKPEKTFIVSELILSFPLIINSLIGFAITRLARKRNILIVNIILNNEYNIGAAMNNDNSVNVADIILVVNIILNNRTL